MVFADEETAKLHIFLTRKILKERNILKNVRLIHLKKELLI